MPRRSSVRRKPPAPSELDGLGIGPNSLRPCPNPGPAVPATERVRILEAWIGERVDWSSRRAAHHYTYGWPGGFEAMLNEEEAMHPVPDVPFDPSMI